MTAISSAVANVARPAEARVQLGGHIPQAEARIVAAIIKPLKYAARSRDLFP